MKGAGIRGAHVGHRIARTFRANVTVNSLKWCYSCRMFETFSFLPPLTNNQIAKQVEYIVANGWTPCLEFAAENDAYVQDKSQVRFGGSASAVRSIISFLIHIVFAESWVEVRDSMLSHVILRTGMCGWL